MTLDFTMPGKVMIMMPECVVDLLRAFQDAEPKMKGTKLSAAPSDPFKVDEDCKKPDQEKAVTFHNLAAKTLYATKCARPDTCTAVAFLTVRVCKPDEDNWCKPCHLMMCVRATCKLVLRLSANRSSVLK